MCTNKVYLLTYIDDLLTYRKVRSHSDTGCLQLIDNSIKSRDASADPTIGGPRGRLPLMPCLYCLKCTKFGQLILRRIIKIVANRCQTSTLKCTKFDSGWGSAPDPASGAYTAPPEPLAGFKGFTFNGSDRRGRGEGRWKGRGMQGRRWRKIRLPHSKFLDPPVRDAIAENDIMLRQFCLPVHPFMINICLYNKAVKQS